MNQYTVVIYDLNQRRPHLVSAIAESAKEAAAKAKGSDIDLVVCAVFRGVLVDARPKAGKT